MITQGTQKGAYPSIVTNAIEDSAYDLQAAAYSQATALSNSFILDTVLLNFSSTETRTITITSENGTVLCGGSYDTSDLNTLYGNTARSISVALGDAITAGENITIDISQTSGACTVDVTVTVVQGTSPISGNPVLGAGDNVIGRVKITDGTEVANVNTLNQLEVSTDQKGYITNVQINSGDSNITYVGKATPGTATSAAGWQIRRIDETTGTIILFADGDINFDNIFDNREALSYS